MRICRECGREINNKKTWYLIYSDFAYCCKACAKKAGFEVTEDDEQ